MPELFVITGANGAGKSTLSADLLPASFSALKVFDGDKYFVEQLSLIFPAQIRSPKYARDEAFKNTVDYFELLVSQAISTKSDFAYEGHFSSEAPWTVIQQFRENNYRITMFFLMVRNLELSQKRVTERVKTGGHFVKYNEVERNYYGNLTQLNKHYNLLDELVIVDNTTDAKLLFHSASNTQIFKANSLPDWFSEYLPALSEI
ncbi:zeta toxin family protein [Emticicia soli]|uniref:Zeta toxin family protein n=1 Tax=Emticicia soli TaxID=2027878 RepID=A0ABW5JA49_9BACT